jgi:hypothetical protein
MKRLTRFIFVAMFLLVAETSGGCCADLLYLQVVRHSNGQVLREYPVKKGDCFTIDYRHSSDHTPVHDIFRISESGEIVLVEEDYLWYGAGLEFNRAVADISSSDFATRVRLHRVFPQFLLRVGEVANHVLTVHRERLPLLNIAHARESLCIQIVQKPAGSP